MDLNPGPNNDFKELKSMKEIPRESSLFVEFEREFTQQENYILHKKLVFVLNLFHF